MKAYHYHVSENFWARVDKTAGPDGCWIWKGHRDARGFARIKVNGRQWLAHKWAFEMQYGAVPEGKLLKPTCGTCGCCNPSHYQVVDWSHINQDTADRHSDSVNNRVVSSLSQRFWSKVAVNSDPGRCWEWTAARYPTGYGSFGLRRSVNHAHRYAWELTHGPIPKGQFVCHRCDNPPCCNPYHLFLGPPKANTADMFQKGRQGYTGKPKKLTWEKAEMIRALFASGEIGRSGLARAVGVSHTTVCKVILREIWKADPEASK